MAEFILTNNDGVGVGIIHDKQENGALVSVANGRARILARFNGAESEEAFTEAIRAILEDVWQRKME